MNQNEDWMLLRIGLPVALGKHTRAWFHVEQSRSALWKAGETAAPKIRRNRHQVRIAEEPVRDEVFHREYRRARRLSWQFYLSARNRLLKSSVQGRSFAPGRSSAPAPSICGRPSKPSLAPSKIQLDA